MMMSKFSKAACRTCFATTLAVAGVAFAANDMPMNPAADMSPQPSSMPAAMNDGTFTTKAADINMTEIKLGKLALSKSNNADVKMFAQRMVDDHTKASDELKQIADNNKWTVSTDDSADSKMMQDQLSNMNGTDFDKAYMKMMAMGHTGAAVMFTMESNNLAANQDLKAYATKYAPTVKEHLDMATKINTSMMAAPAQ